MALGPVAARYVPWAMIERLRVEPGTDADLDRRPTDDKLGLAGKKEAVTLLPLLVARISELQARLAAEAERSVLVVLQGMDASGKDGAIRQVFTGVNPQGVQVTSYKPPTDDELAHDYLWRVHCRLPPRGHIGIGNRSHYEDVIAVRVRKLVPEHVWRRRYRHIREFERMLVDEGTAIVKVFLHIGFDEQRRRLQDRLDEPQKHWKFRRSDLDDRKLWPEYEAAYTEAIHETSTEWAPWYVVPGDRKWARNVAICSLLIKVLEEMDPRYPPPEPDLEGLVVE
jgi:PPK2 family polyphosphate:nucleotide phosphotransferase